jgi:biotin carboxyl carrier protein
VVAGDDLARARADRRALRELVVDGVDTNTSLLRATVRRPELARLGGRHRRGSRPTSPALVARRLAARPRRLPTGRAGSSDRAAARTSPEGTVVAPTRATVVAVKVGAGEIVAAGQELVVLEAMKMQQAVVAPSAGTVEAILAPTGQVVAGGDPLVRLRPGGAA